MYIRTKEKIYKVFESPLNDDEDFVYVAPNGCISETDIIKQSENLAELCDEFVDDTYKDFYNIKKENETTFVWSMKQRFKYWNSIDFNFIGTIYGAIYTDKGLIYVAKMNDKGELELI